MYKKHILWKRGSGDIKIPEEGSKDKKTELTHMERTNSYFTNSNFHNSRYLHGGTSMSFKLLFCFPK